MVEILRDVPERSAADVVADLKREVQAVGDSAPSLSLFLSKLDFDLLRGFAGRKDILKQEPWMVALMRLNVIVTPDYTGRPRLMGISPFGDGKQVDVLAEVARREQVKKQAEWREADARLRQDINGRALR